MHRERCVTTLLLLLVVTIAGRCSPPSESTSPPSTPNSLPPTPTTTTAQSTTTTPADRLQPVAPTEELVEFIHRHASYRSAGVRIADVFPNGGSRDRASAEPVLWIAFGHWEDDTAEYLTMDVHYGCDRWPNGLVAGDSGFERIYPGFDGIGVDDSGEECLQDLESYPSAFYELHATRALSIDVTEDALTIEVAGIQHTFFP